MGSCEYQTTLWRGHTDPPRFVLSAINPVDILPLIFSFRNPCLTPDSKYAALSGRMRVNMSVCVCVLVFLCSDKQLLLYFIFMDVHLRFNGNRTCKWRQRLRYRGKHSRGRRQHLSLKITQAVILFIDVRNCC